MHMTDNDHVSHVYVKDYTLKLDGIYCIIISLVLGWIFFIP